MAADVQVTFTPDSDPNVVSGLCSFLVNGTAVGSVAFTPTATMVSFSSITPAPPALVAGAVVTGFLVTTDNQVPPLSSPQIPFPSVTIKAAQPPPAGVTNVTSKQVGSP